MQAGAGTEIWAAQIPGIDKPRVADRVFRLAVSDPKLQSSQAFQSFEK